MSGSKLQLVFVNFRLCSLCMKRMVSHRPAPRMNELTFLTNLATTSATCMTTFARVFKARTLLRVE